MIVEIDYDDLKSGFQVGRAAALSDWRDKQEARAFVKLVNRLRYRKWATGPGRDVRLASRARFNAKPEQRRKAVDRAKRHTIKRQRERLGKVIHCEASGCTAQWCRAPKQRGPQPRFCSVACICRAQRAAKKAKTS